MSQITQNLDQQDAALQNQLQETTNEIDDALNEFGDSEEEDDGDEFASFV